MTRSSRLLTLLALLAALVAASAQTAAAADVPFRGNKWPGGRVTYFVATPKYFRWSIEKAAAQMNSIGARVKFVRTRSRRSAGIVITEYTKPTPWAGYASLGYLGSRQGFVWLKRKPMGAPNGVDKYRTIQIVAHEFGHVLGLDHARHSLCSMMSYGFWESCKFLDDGPNWTCNVIRPPDVRALRSKYGKRKRRTPKGCPMFRGATKPTTTSSLRYNGDAAWDESGNLRLTFGFTPFTAAPNGDTLKDQTVDVTYLRRACAGASAKDWEGAMAYNSNGQSLDPGSGSAAVLLDEFDVTNGALCFRLRSDATSAIPLLYPFVKSTYSNSVQVTPPPVPPPTEPLPE